MSQAENADQTASPAEVTCIEAVEHAAWLDIYAAAPENVRSSLGIFRRNVDGGALLVCSGIDNIQFNRLAGLGVVSPVQTETLDEALAELARAGVRNWVVHIAQGAADLQRMCEARGLVAHPRTWAKFIRGSGPVAPKTMLSVREATAKDAESFGSIVTQTYGLPASVAQWMAALVGRPHWHCLLAFDRETPVATGAMYIKDEAAWLGIGATLPSRRRQGAQSALLAARIDVAARHGCRTLTTETGVPHPGEAGPSYHNIQRAGFRVAYLRPNFRRS